MGGRERRCRLLDATEDPATLPDLRGRTGLATVDVAKRLGIHASTHRASSEDKPLADNTATMFDVTPPPGRPMTAWRDQKNRRRRRTGR